MGDLTLAWRWNFFHDFHDFSLDFFGISWYFNGKFNSKSWNFNSI